MEDPILRTRFALGFALGLAPPGSDAPGVGVPHAPSPLAVGGRVAEHRDLRCGGRTDGRTDSGELRSVGPGSEGFCRLEAMCVLEAIALRLEAMCDMCVFLFCQGGVGWMCSRCDAQDTSAKREGPGVSKTGEL